MEPLTYLAIKYPAPICERCGQLMLTVTTVTADECWSELERDTGGHRLQPGNHRQDRSILHGALATVTYRPLGENGVQSKSTSGGFPPWFCGRRKIVRAFDAPNYDPERSEFCRFYSRQDS
jgi:hypothetical protein